MRKNRLTALLAALLISCVVVAGAAFPARAESSSNDQGEYRQKMEALLQDLDRKIEELERKIDADLDAAKTDAGETKQDLKQNWNALLLEMKKSRAAAAETYRKLKDSSAQTWDKTKTDMDHAADHLQESYHKALKWFQK